MESKVTETFYADDYLALFFVTDISQRYEASYMFRRSLQDFVIPNKTASLYKHADWKYFHKDSRYK